ncbi:hypothetical protein [Gottfriedia luciferensis]|uniref:hypothetical protein n=1 Tax=Gottfriedia luciferensis TaxID=178774 RepID=UPI000B449AAB|nr:hypothetical protein [Gottfriedia luciferensis]
MEQLDIFSQNQTKDPLFSKLANLQKSEHFTVETNSGEILIKNNQFGKYEYFINGTEGVCSNLDKLYLVVKSYINQIVLEEGVEEIDE